MTSFYLLAPEEISPLMSEMIRGVEAGAGRPGELIREASRLPDLRRQKLVFAAQLDEIGQDQGILSFLKALHARGKDALAGAEAVILVSSPNELFTKSFAQSVVFLANRLGCRFPGHPLVEATVGYRNLRTWQKNMRLPVEEIARQLCRRQGARLVRENPPPVLRPRILALHASSRRTSNTVMLWDMIRPHLSGCETEELRVDNGMVLDCRGCGFKECLHYSEQSSCFYGGVVVKEIFPAIERADALVWICPNYNDAVSANLMAVINRMTALYRKSTFYRKALFSVIVSGNSGGDSVAKQLIGALNINKGFSLPPHFAVMATAHDPGDVETVPGIAEQAKAFAKNILHQVAGRK